MDKYLDHRGSSIHYRISGSGKNVVLIHGFGEDGSVWKRQAEYLKDQFHLIIPDLPGSGTSQLIGNISIEGMADVVNSILDNENISDCTVIGHSMGGYITLAFAEKYSSVLNGFGLFHSTSYADNDERKATRRKSIEFIKQHGAFEFLKNITPNLFSPGSNQKLKKEINEFISGLNYFTPEALITYYEAMINRPERNFVLEQSGVPVLFVIGRYDSIMPMDDLLKQSHLPSKAFIHILQESGHMGMIEETDKSNTVLENFLKSV